MASVRFICGTQDLHRALEERLASFLGKDDTILFAACFDANGGLFEPLLGPEDAVVSDALNHASIIDGIRLCKARRYRYANADMDDLEVQLTAARADGARTIMIATDGVFSMDGYLAPLPEITALAERYDAIVMVDDCHATGFMGPKGRGTPHHFGVADKVHILTGTLGKALGGAIGGYIAGPQPVIDLLRQRARPYLFSNALAPAVCAAGIAAIDLVEENDDLPNRAFRQRTLLALRGSNGSASTFCPASTPSSPSCWARRGWRRTWRPRSTMKASMSPDSSSRRAPWPRPHPHPDERGAHPRRPRPRARRFRGRWPQDRSPAMTNEMRALVKAAPKWASGWKPARARDRPRRRPDPGQEDRHLRHRHPYLAMGRLGRSARFPSRLSPATNSRARS
jgi:hypothetical protein